MIKALVRTGESISVSMLRRRDVLPPPRDLQTLRQGLRFMKNSDTQYQKNGSVPADIWIDSGAFVSYAERVMQPHVHHRHHHHAHSVSAAICTLRLRPKI